MYTYKVTKVDNLKKRIDFYFTVYKDGRSVGDDCLPIYSETFFGISSDQIEELVKKLIAEQAKKFTVAEDVLSSSSDFSDLINREIKLEE